MFIVKAQISPCTSKVFRIYKIYHQLCICCWREICVYFPICTTFPFLDVVFTENNCKSQFVGLQLFGNFFLMKCNYYIMLEVKYKALKLFCLLIFCMQGQISNPGVVYVKYCMCLKIYCLLENIDIIFFLINIFSQIKDRCI